MTASRRSLRNPIRSFGARIESVQYYFTITLKAVWPFWATSIVLHYIADPFWRRRLNTAYVLKESFGQLWDYEREGWARRFFENWRASLKWQRLAPYEKFAEMIDRHWDGIAAYCKPENKVSLGFVEGLNNKIRVIQRRAYGLRDQEYLRLKVLTCMLPAL